MASLVLLLFPACGGHRTEAPAMVRGDTEDTNQGWIVKPLFTVGEDLHGYRPPGILDGLGAFRRRWSGTVRVLITHEIEPDKAYPYTLANGTELVGARVTYLDVGRRSLAIRGAGLAYDTVYDRQGREVVGAPQINEIGDARAGFGRLCSARLVSAGEYGFVDDIFFVNEESGQPYTPHGGSIWALDIEEAAVWALPELGRGQWENVTPLDPGDPTRVALLLGDDSTGAPLYLWLGTKDARGNGSFLDRNGLASGTLSVWVAEDGSRSPQDFYAVGERRDGVFLPLPARDEKAAGTEGHDEHGYRDHLTLHALADEMGAYSFSRPEDLHEDPNDPHRAVLASTGHAQAFPRDEWGDLYLVDVDFTTGKRVAARLTMLRNADERSDPDSGIRSPDNLTWSRDGHIYVQEDRGTTRFARTSGIEASIWRVDPESREDRRILQIDRAAAPPGVTDRATHVPGAWETSGILDVTNLFPAKKGETVLLSTVQAHGVSGGPVGGDQDLVEGGQLVLLTNRTDRFDDRTGLYVGTAFRIGLGTAFLIAGLACFIATALGLPGTWILIGLGFIVELTDRWYFPDGQHVSFGWWLLVICLLAALVGEGLEFGASALGAGSAGSSKWGMTGAILGGVIGAVGGAFIPLPAIGSLIGAVIGTFLGAILGEIWGAKASIQGSLKPATGATVGRILGTVVKLPIAVLVWGMLTIAAYWP